LLLENFLDIKRGFPIVTSTKSMVRSKKWCNRSYSGKKCAKDTEFCAL